MSQNIDIVIVDKIQAGIKQKIEDIGHASEAAHAKLVKLQKAMQLRLNLSNVTTTPIDRAVTSTQRWTTANNSLISSLSRVKLSLSSVNTSLANVERSFTTATSRVRGFLATLLLIGTTGKMTEILDTFQTIQNQLSLSSDSPQQMNNLTTGIFEMAQRARVPLEGLAKTWRRVDDAVKQYGVGQERSLGITETMAGLLTLSGANATEASASLLQLSQAFSKGKLDGDEFRTTAELMPAVLREVASVMGVTQGELFDLSRAGKITTEVLVKAFESLEGKVATALETMPKTIGQAFTELKNAFTFELSKNATESGFVASIVSGLQLITQNFDIAAKVALGFGAALATMAGIGVVGWLVSLINPISSLSLALVGLIGYFGYFSSQLKVAGEGSASLSSAVKVLFTDLKNLVTDQPWDKVFSVETAQKALDGLLQGLKGLVNINNAVIATFHGMKSAIQSAFSRYEGITTLVTNVQKLYILLHVNILQTLKEIKDALANLLPTNWGTAITDKIKGTATSALQVLKDIGNRVNNFGYGPEFTKSITEAQNKINNFNTDALESSINESGKALSNPLNLAKTTLDNIDNAIRVLAQSDEWKGTGLFDNVPDAGKKVTKTFDDIKNEIKSKYSELNAETDNYFKSVEERARKTEWDEFTQRLNALESGELTDVGIDFSTLRPDGEAWGNVATSVKEAASASGAWKNNFADIQQYAQAMQEGMKSINASGFKDFAKYENTLREREIRNAVGQNPEAYSKTFTPQFIERMKEAYQTQQDYNAAANKTPEIIDNVGKSQTNLNTVQQQAPASFSDPNVIQQSSQLYQQVGQAAQTAGQSVGQAFQTGAQTAQQALQGLQSVSFDSIGGSAERAGQSIGQSITQGAGSAQQAIQQMATSAISSLSEVAAAAQRAASAVSAVGSAGLGGGLPGFSTGGYTGNMPTTSVAGVVHGQEYVIPAGPAKKYRPILEAIRAGRVPTVPPSNSYRGGSGGGTTAMNVTVENYGNSQISVEQLSPNDIRIIAREEARNEGVKAVAAAIRNPNSRVSKSLTGNTTANRRR